MTITLEPELESELRQKAAAQGQNPEQYFSELIIASLRPLPQETPVPLPQGSPEWKVLLLSMGRPLGVSLPLAVTSRENLYGDDLR